MENSFICASSKERFLEFVSGNPELSSHITKKVGDRRREIESRIEQLMFQDAGGRVATILCDLFENHSDETQNGPGIRFSHQDIAELTGLTRPTTIKLLNEFQEEGWIELGRNNIMWKDDMQLKRRGEPTIFF